MKLKHICFMDRMGSHERPIDKIEAYFKGKVKDFDFGMLTQRFIDDPKKGLALVSEMEVPDVTPV